MRNYAMNSGKDNRRRYYSKRYRRAIQPRFIVIISALAVVVIVSVILLVLPLLKSNNGNNKVAGNSPSASISVSSSTQPGTSSSSTKSPSPSLSQSAAPPVNFTVAAGPNTDPSKFNLDTKIYNGTTQLDSYTRQEPIFFGQGKDYTNLEGIITFRGNNYREGASYGTANITQGTLSQPIWNIPTGSVLKKGGKSGSWTGSCWTGQPLIIKWPEDIKKFMNIYPQKKADPNLVEVIYACADGNIYFRDLKNGTATRPTIKTGGGPMKGTASIYLDGTPILFVGPADDPPGMQTVRARMYSLIDQKLIYTFGQERDPDSYRISYTSYDASPLFDVKTDTIIEPGENGILYTIKLNTKFDKTTGTLSVSPGDPVKMNYTSPVYNDKVSLTSPNNRWYGWESSPVIWKNYMMCAENGGYMFCVDLNTMKVAWLADLGDDTDSTTVLEESPKDNTAYIYTCPEVDHQNNSVYTSGGDVLIRKLNVKNGDVVWKSKPYHCYAMKTSTTEVKGGALATPVLGKNDISNLVIYTIARTPALGKGLMVALDKNTGKEVWTQTFDHYCWSSPVSVYTPQGKSYIIQCDSVGNMFLLEGTTGKILSQINLGESNIEASPAVFGNTVVIGTRIKGIYAVQIS